MLACPCKESPKRVAPCMHSSPSTDVPQLVTEVQTRFHVLLLVASVTAQA